MINWLMCLIKGDINNNDVPDCHEITWDIIQGALEEEDLENDRLKDMKLYELIHEAKLEDMYRNMEKAVCFLVANAESEIKITYELKMRDIDQHFCRAKEKAIDEVYDACFRQEIMYKGDTGRSAAASIIEDQGVYVSPISTPMFDLAGRLKAQIKVIMNEHEQEKTTSNNRHGDH